MAQKMFMNAKSHFLALLEHHFALVLREKAEYVKFYEQKGEIYFTFMGKRFFTIRNYKFEEIVDGGTTTYEVNATYLLSGQQEERKIQKLWCPTKTAGHSSSDLDFWIVWVFGSKKNQNAIFRAVFTMRLY
jgi:hypothetical protein